MVRNDEESRQTPGTRTPNLIDNSGRDEGPSCQKEARPEYKYNKRQRRRSASERAVDCSKALCDAIAGASYQCCDARFRGGHWLLAESEKWHRMDCRLMVRNSHLRHAKPS